MKTTTSSVSVILAMALLAPLATAQSDRHIPYKGVLSNGLEFAAITSAEDI